MKNDLTQIIRNHIDNWLYVIESNHWPQETAAIYFGLFELVDSGFEIYVAFCSHFDVDESDWACDEIEEADFRYAKVPFNKDSFEWDEFENIISPIIRTWTKKMESSNKLKNIHGIAHGFDSGDLTVVYQADV